MAVALSPQFPGSFNKATHQVWWIWVALLIEAVGLLLVAGLLLTAAPRSEKERCYEDEAQVRALDNWRASGCRGWVATDGPSKPQDFGQLVDQADSRRTAGDRFRPTG